MSRRACLPAGRATRKGAGLGVEDTGRVARRVAVRQRYSKGMDKDIGDLIVFPLSFSLSDERSAAV